MKDKIFQLTLENLGHYEIRLLPNINDLNKDKSYMSFKSMFGHMGWNQCHISYALINGEIKIWIYGNVVAKNISSTFNIYEQNDLWNVSKNKFLNINTSEKQGFLKVDIKFDEDNKYNFYRNRKYIEDLFETIKHIKLEDVLYQELFKRSNLKWDNNYTGKPIRLYDVYCDEYTDFKERYFNWLRNKKIKKIIG